MPPRKGGGQEDQQDHIRRELDLGHARQEADDESPYNEKDGVRDVQEAG
jgi:hypothetical protein